MRKRWSSFLPSICGGASSDFGLSGEKPKKRKVLVRSWRSGRSLRIHKTTPSQSNFSSANSRRERNDCLLASCVICLGNATYRMFVSWSKTESQLDEILSVTCSLIVMRVGDFWATICEIKSSSSSSSSSLACFAPFSPIEAVAPSSSSSMNDKEWCSEYSASFKSSDDDDDDEDVESKDVLRV